MNATATYVDTPSAVQVERVLTVDPGLTHPSYVVAYAGDQVLFDVLVDGPATVQYRDIARMVRKFDIDRVEVDPTGIGIIFMYALTHELDVPVQPNSSVPNGR